MTFQNHSLWDLRIPLLTEKKSKSSKESVILDQIFLTHLKPSFDDFENSNEVKPLHRVVFYIFG